MNEATKALGAAMHQAVAAGDIINGCTREIGTLFMHLTRYGNEWALELCDETPIDIETCKTWQYAVGAPAGLQWRFMGHDKVARCEWTGTEDAAPAGSKVTRISWAK